jgi:predicted small secreted protein
MKVKFPTIFAVLVLLGVAPVLSACNTTAGAGRDIAATGNVITDEANKNKPR